MKTKLLAITLAVFALSGCGGGGDSTDPVVIEPPPPTVAASVSLIPFKTVYGGTAVSGTKYSFALTGTDSGGESYTGQYTLEAKGQTVFEGKSVYHVQEKVTVSMDDGIFADEIGDIYWEVPNQTLYKIVKSDSSDILSGGRIRYLRDAMDVGYYSSAGSVTTIGNVTTEENLVTRLESESNGNVKLLFATSYIGSSLTERDFTYYLNSTGAPYKISILVTYFGNTINLQSN